MNDSTKIASLRAELSQGDLMRQLTAANTLLTNPHLAQSLTPELMRLLATEDESLRETCIGALESMGAPDKDSAEPLSRFLEADELQGFWAATLLGRLGPDAGPAVTLLARALSQSTSIAVQERCAWALGQIGQGAKEALPELEAAAKSVSPRLARFAKEAVEKLRKT